MKIAIIMPVGEQRGGGEMMLIDLMQQGHNSDIKWLVIFLEDGPMVKQIQDLGIDVRVVPSGRLRQPHRFIATVGNITSLVRLEQVSVVVGWMSKAHLYGSPASALANRPSLWYQLGVPANDNWMDRIATILPGRGVVTLSKVGQEAQVRLWPKRPTPLVYPGVALERFDASIMPSPTEVRRKLGLPLNSPLIGIVGRLQRWKGMHVLVEAMPKVLQRHPDTHCIVIGGKHNLEADYEDYLKERIATLGLDKQVVMAGLQRNVPEWMQAMDIVVHASNKEPFGIVVIEAMALGKPIVAGNAGGPREIVTDGVNGLLTPYGDADALAEALLHYLDDPEFARKVGAAARERAHEFSTECYAQNFIKAIRDLVPTVS
jgi:glycosyltransferase involved in cell wall biosynthesis